MQRLRQLELEGGYMNLLIWLIVGGIIGWIASLIMETDAEPRLMQSQPSNFRSKFS